MEQVPLQDQILAAERDKYLAEAKKAEAEEKKILFELNELKKEAEKKWFLKKELRYNISKWLVGIGFLIFFLNYVVIPAATKDNIDLAVKNAQMNSNLYEREKLLKEKETLLKSNRDSLLAAKFKLSAAQMKYLDLKLKTDSGKLTSYDLLNLLHKVLSDSTTKTNKVAQASR